MSEDILSFDEHRRRRDENASSIRCTLCGKRILATASRCSDCGIRGIAGAVDFGFKNRHVSGLHSGLVKNHRAGLSAHPPDARYWPGRTDVESCLKNANTFPAEYTVEFVRAGQVYKFVRS